MATSHAPKNLSRRQELQEKDERSLVGVAARGGGVGKTATLEEFLSCPKPAF